MPDGEPGGELLDAALAARGIDAPWVGLGRPRRRLGRRRRRRGAVDVGLPPALRGVPGLGARGRVANPAAQRRRRLRLERRQGLPRRARRRVPVVPTAPARRRDLVTGLGRAGPGGTSWSSRGSGPAASAWSSPSARRRAAARPDGPGRGSCSRWSSRCAPRARPRSSCSAAAPSPRSTSCPVADEIRVHEQYGGAPSPCPWARSAPRWPSGRSLRRATVRRRAGVRPRRHDALGGRLGGQRARAHRARPLPRRRPDAGRVRRLVASLRWERSQLDY